MPGINYFGRKNNCRSREIILFYEFSVSTAFQRHQDFPIPFGETVKTSKFLAFHIHSSTATVVSSGNHTPSQVTNQDLAGCCLLFYNQSDKSPDSGLQASDSSNKCIRPAFSFPSDDFRPEKERLIAV